METNTSNTDIVDLEKKKQEFEELLIKQETERQQMKMKKRIHTETNKDPKEMMLVIQKNFREQYDFINDAVQNQSQEIKVDELFEKFNSLKEYFVSTNYSLTSYDKQLYKEQLEKLEKTLQNFREKNQPRKKFTFSKKSNFEKKVDIPVQKPTETPVNAVETNPLAMIKGIENKNNETIKLTQNDLDASFKLVNLENCTVHLDGRVKALFLYNLKECKIYAGVVEGAAFFDNCNNTEFQLVAHQFRIHNTKNTKFYLFATSKPIIEHSTNLQFAKYQYSYPNFEKDFKDSGFEGRENLYFDVQDFNWLKQEKSPNFTVVS